jgi:hypothetical protein
MNKEGAAPKGFYHFMVKRFLKEDKDLTSRVWAREIKIAKKIFNSRPDVYFWNQVDLGFSLNSLAWLLTEEGEHTLNIQKKTTSFTPRKNKAYKLADEKIGKDKKITKKKNKTLMDFLNESKKN